MRPYLDLIVSSWDPEEPLRFFQNDRAGGFEERTGVAQADAHGTGALEDRPAADPPFQDVPEIFAAGRQRLVVTVDVVSRGCRYG